MLYAEGYLLHEVHIYLSSGDITSLDLYYMQGDWEMTENSYETLHISPTTPLPDQENVNTSTEMKFTPSIMS